MAPKHVTVQLLCRGDQLVISLLLTEKWVSGCLVTWNCQGDRVPGKIEGIARNAVRNLAKLGKRLTENSMVCHEFRSTLRAGDTICSHSHIFLVLMCISVASCPFELLSSCSRTQSWVYILLGSVLVGTLLGSFRLVHVNAAVFKSFFCGTSFNQ